MAEAVILYWRDIPSQVTVKAGRQAARRELPLRFIEAIDRAAMRSGAAGTDAYLDAWRRGDPMPCGDELEAEAGRIATELETAYDPARLKALSDHGGREP